MSDILSGLELLAQPESLLWLLIGLCLGFVVGVLPGLGPSTTAALLLPVSVGLPLDSALILIVSMYAGSAFAGAVPAILLNIPGEAGSVVTAMDGYPMAKAGKAELAIGIARMASVAGGVIGGTIVLVLLQPLSSLALQFGRREIFIVAVLGLVVIASLVGDSVRKGLLSGVVGVLIAAMSASPLTGQPRFTLGFLELYGEVPYVPALIGLFALSEMFILSRPAVANPAGEALADAVPRFNLRGMLGQALSGVGETLRRPVAVIRSSLIGLGIGMIPGTGTSIGNFISYSVARRQSKHPETFGKGEPEGVIAAEACDNAVTTGSLVPTLTLGIPGSGTTAILLAALYLQGVAPGPQIMTTNGPEAYAVILAMIVASILILPLGVLLATPLVYFARLPKEYLIPTVLLVCIAGVFSMRNSVFDVGLAVVFGVLGVLMRSLGYPIVPLVMGLVLGPIAEKNFMQALTLGDGDWMYFFQSPTALVLWGLVIVLVGYSVLGRRKPKAPAEMS